jgi:hypothetical protein
MRYGREFLLRWCVLALLGSLLFLCGRAEAGPPAPRKIEFNRDIRPILSDKCYACHGPDKNKRKADLRLDQKESAFLERKGRVPLVAGHPDQSELYLRITASEPGRRMPPPKSGRSLSPDQEELLRRWIEEGAEWQPHWSYLKPLRREPPEVAARAWVKNPLDRFILEKLESLQVSPSPEADRATLLRRLSLDLIGLPPAWEEVEGFQRDERPDAFEKRVDLLLASPHFGERMALWWLDLVRYADTTGIHGDNHRDVAPYRDYVIRAFNENKPFDRFTVEQIAGDLLPEPSLESRVGSGYNRLLMTTNEGGAQAKEYIAKYAADRVRNASVVWLGATLGCAECHDHKFDPYTTRDFYRFGAFFGDLEEKVPAEPGPPFPVPTPEETARIRELDLELAAVSRRLETATPELAAAQAEWEATALEKAAGLIAFGPWRSLGPFGAASFDEAHDTAFGPEKELDLQKSYREGKLHWTEIPLEDGKVHPLSGQNCATYLFRTITAREPAPLVLSLGSDDGLRVWLDGKQLLDRRVLRAAAPDQEKLTLNLKAGENRLLLKVTNAAGDYGLYFKPLVSGLPERIAALVKRPAAERSEPERAELTAHYRSIAPLLEPARKSMAELKRKREEIEKSVPRTLVSMAAPPRTVHVLPRGNWLDESGEVVEPGVPGFLKQLEVKDRRPTRLDLARWLVSPENPLPARVVVNRLWKLYFGAGLTRTPDDLGSQGGWPTHPELLDWLAVEFQEKGWDLKYLVRLMVTSASYRQSADTAREIRERDPYNDLLARQAPFRLDAELVRDTVLSVSGLLVPKVGGPSVKPYQPPLYWSHLNFPVREYQSDHGESLYHRGLYTYWCRTFLHPSLLAFDAPTREECTVNRPRSNTPLQALVLLNDPTYVEAARVFAERIVKSGGPEFAERLRWAFRRALSRDPRPAEAEVLSALYRKHRREYGEDPAAAEKLVGVGEWPKPKELDLGELAAWTSVARAVLNLHETITRS